MAKSRIQREKAKHRTGMIKSRTIDNRHCPKTETKRESLGDLFGQLRKKFLF